MSNLTFHSAGESHGRGSLAFVEGFPFGVPVDLEAINQQLARRQKGHGRGGRMQIEADKVEFTQGLDITIVTTARKDEEALELLKAFGFPFRES